MAKDWLWRYNHTMEFYCDYQKDRTVCTLSSIDLSKFEKHLSSTEESKGE